MTSTEKKLLTEALYWRVRYEDSNPDVGMGPMLDTLLDEIKPAGLVVTPEERRQVIATVRKQRG